MLNNDDRAAIQGLFDRLRNVERRTAPRDPEAEALIRDEISRQPGAPYYMAQTILVQEHALSAAQDRIKELEQELDRGSRDDVFGGLFGGGGDRRRRRNDDAVAQGGPWDRRNATGGGFLAGAAQTALGVTGGVLLGSAIASMLGAGTAAASETPAADQPNETEPDAGNDDFGGFDDGGGFDTGGGFDFGGDL